MDKVDELAGIAGNGEASYAQFENILDQAVSVGLLSRDFAHLGSRKSYVRGQGDEATEKHRCPKPIIPPGYKRTSLATLYRLTWASALLDSSKYGVTPPRRSVQER